MLNPFACLECPRLWMQAPDVQALREVDILVTRDDFLLALRGLELWESPLQRLRRLTMDERGNSVLSNAVTLDSLGMLLCFSARKYHVD